MRTSSREAVQCAKERFAAHAERRRNREIDNFSFSWTLQVRANETIAGVKQQIRQLRGIPVEEQRLFLVDHGHANEVKLADNLRYCTDDMTMQRILPERWASSFALYLDVTLEGREGGRDENPDVERDDEQSDVAHSHTMFGTAGLRPIAVEITGKSGQVCRV